MKLNWDLEVMKNAREKLLQKETLDDYDKYILDFYDFRIDKKAKLYKAGKKLTDEQILNQLSELKQEYITFLKNTPLNSRVILYFIESLKLLNLNFEFNQINNNKISNQELFDNSYLIFGSISPYLQKELDHIYKNKLVKVIKMDSKKDSCCYIDISNKLGYVYVKNANYYSKETVVNHELAHSIIASVNPKFFYDENSLFREFHSSFMQLYTDKFLYDKTKDKKYLYSICNLFDSLKNWITDISIINEVAKIRGNLTKEKIAKQLLENNYIKVDDFNLFFNEFLSCYNLSLHLTYLLGTCYSLNLLNKDLKDTKRMFIDSIYNNFNNYDEFLKIIDFDYNDPYLMSDLFNESACELKKVIRKKEMK